MSFPLISVVMSVYNGEKYLSEAIESILTQTYKNFEFIIINDGSTDKSLEIIKSYHDERIAIISHENKGLIASLNEGIEKSKGKYIARMDADDISLPSRFEEQAEVLDRMSNIDIVGCRYQLVDENSTIKREANIPITKDDILLSLCYSVPFAHPSVMIRKKVFKNNRYEDNPTEDYLLWSRVYNDNFYNINKIIFQYRHQYGLSFSDTKRINMIKSQLDVAKYFIKKNRNAIYEKLKNTHKHSIYASRASVLIFIYFDKIMILKIMFNNPKNIFNFLKYYIRHFIRTTYWKIFKYRKL